MDQTLSLQGIMKHYRERWSKLPDTRKANNNTRYDVADGALAALAVFLMQSSSFLAHQRLLESQNGKNNAHNLFQVEEIPSDPQIRNLLDPLNNAEFQEDFWYNLDELKAEKQLQQDQNELGTYAIALDRVAFFLSGRISYSKCLKREDRNGTEHYYHSSITPVFVKPSQAQVVSLLPEFIVPRDGKEKQDCERTAAKRWLKQHHPHFENHTITYLGDDIYAHQPLCQLISGTYHQYFIFVCKPESHAGLYEWLKFIEKNDKLGKLTHRQWNGKYGELWQYGLAQQVPLRNGSDAMQVNWLELIISHEVTGKMLYHNTFVTNHEVSLESVALLTRVGRTRWKIENENNNTLKTKGYHMEHNFGHGQQDLANVLATLNILAFLIHTVQEIIEPTYQLVRRVFREAENLF